MIKRIVPEKRSRQKKNVSSNGNQPFFYRKVQGLKTGLKTKKKRGLKPGLFFGVTLKPLLTNLQRLMRAWNFMSHAAFFDVTFSGRCLQAFFLQPGCHFLVCFGLFYFLYAFLVSFLLTCGPAHTLETKTLAERKGKKT